MASTESRGRMLFTIEIMKERLTSSGLPPLALALTNCRRNAIHRVAIGDSQCVRHQLFAELRIRMVDGESVRQKLYPRGCDGLGLVGREDRRWHGEVRSAVHVDIPRQARRKRAVRLRAGDRSLRR